MRSKLVVVLSFVLFACGPTGGSNDAGSAVDSGASPDADGGDAGAADSGVADAGSGCAPFDLTPYASSSCFCGAECDCYLDVPWGTATWTEANRSLSQSLDLFLPKADAGADGGVRPLVVWAHPNGTTKTVGSGGVGQSLGLPVLREGYAFASIEFRHPFVNRNIGAPRTDVATAIQFLRCNGASFGIDRERVAGVGRSRGTLLVWTAVQDELAQPTSSDPVARESTRLRGVWAINAQTSYWGPWIAPTFFDAASQPAILASMGTTNYGHAVGDVTADDPPVHFVYDSPLAVLPLSASVCAPNGAIDCLHLPNFGDQFCRAASDAGIGTACTAQYDRPASTVYDALPFLRSVLAP